MIAIVDDDGVGFNAHEMLSQAAPQEHLGLRSMQERVELLGGVFTVESIPGEGTTVFARLPLQKNPDSLGAGRELTAI